MLLYLSQGLLLGGTAAAQPGPFQAYLLAQTLKNGWRRTLLATFAPLLSDGPIVVLVLLVLTQTPEWFLNMLRLAGGCFLLYLGWRAYCSLQEIGTLTVDEAESSQQSLLKAALMNALSPNPYIFWATIAGPIFLEAWQMAPRLGFGFVLGFYGTLIGGFIGFVFLFATMGRLDARVSRLLTLFSAVALLLFGLYQIGLGVRGIII